MSQKEYSDIQHAVHLLVEATKALTEAQRQFDQQKTLLDNLLYAQQIVVLSAEKKG